MPSASLSTEWPSPPQQQQPMIVSVDGLAVIPSHAYVVGRERTEVEIVPVPSASEQHLFDSPLLQPEYSYIPVGNQEPAEQELQRIEPEQQLPIQSENSGQQLQDQQRTQVQPLQQQQQIQDQQHTQVQQLQQQQQTQDQQPTQVPQLQQQQLQDQQQMPVQQLQQQFQNQQQMQVPQVQQQQHHEVQQSTAAAPVDQKQYSYYYNNNNNINNNNKHDDDQQQQHSYHYYYQQNLVQQQQQLQLQQQQNNNNNVYNSVYSALPLPFGGVSQFNYHNNYGGVKYQPQPPHPLLQNHYHRGRQLMRRGSRSQQQVAHDNFYHHQHPQQPKTQSEYGAGGETDNVIGIKYDQAQQDQAGGVKQHQPGPPFRPSHPVWASQYPVPWTYYVKTSIVQPPLPPSAGVRYSQHGGGAAGNYYGGRKSRYVPVAGGAAVNRVNGYSAAAKTPRTKVVYIEYGGFKPKMVPSVQISTSEDYAAEGTGNRRHSPAAAIADGGDDDGFGSETVVTVTQSVVPESTPTDVGQRDNTAATASSSSSSPAAEVVEVSASTTSIADTTSETPSSEQQQQPEPEQQQQPAAGVVVVVVWCSADGSHVKILDIPLYPPRSRT